MERLEIRAGLRLATFDDCLLHGKILTNKTVFIKNRLNGQFEALYKLPNHYECDDSEKDKIWKESNEYNINEIKTAIIFQNYYVLSEQYNSLHFNFKLILREAEFDDLTYTSTFVKENALYFVRVNAMEISGPHYLPETASASYVRKAIQDKKLFVPIKEQTYEPIKLSNAS